jgi:hypothetical protein
MNKKLLVLLTAALLLVSATACSRGPGTSNTTEDSAADTKDAYIVVGTDEFGNDVTQNGNTTLEPEETQFDPSEEAPTFVDVSKKVVVFTAVATVRTSTVLADNNSVGWPQEGKILDVTGESENWYRIDYNVNGETQTCYIAKTVAADASVLDAFTPCEEEEVEVSESAVNVRSYPSTASNNSIRGSLKKGEKVIRVAVSEKWSRIKYEVVSETETDAEGKPVVTVKEYYISNDCITVPSAATEAPTDTEAN